MSSSPTVPREIRIIRHCNLFYWWPVWAVGFLMAGLTWAFGHDEVMAIVPAGSTVANKQAVTLAEGKAEVRDVIVLPPTKGNTQFVTPVHVSRSKNPGVLFCIVLLLVIAITNIPLRGLWSVFVIVFVITMSIVFAYLEWWETILEYISYLDIRINLGGYLLISSVLFLLWLIVFLFFDPQIYMVFTPGQLRVRLEIGDAETAYDTTGMTIQKQRSDLFRHWILGFGSGDLLVNTAGAQAHHFDMPNVLFIGQKVREIENMLRSRQVVATQETPPE